MEAIARLHAIPAPLIVGALVLLAVAAALTALTGRPAPGWLDVGRRVLLGLLVAEAALGLTLALRGSSPSEWIHWLYGVLIIVALLLPGAIGWTGASPGRRGGALSLASMVAAIFAWRLWASG